MGVAAAAEPKRVYRDTKTRYEGVYARHSLKCDKAIDKDNRCTCDPTYYGVVWDNEIGRNRKTERRPLIGEAKNLRVDLLAEVRTGSVAERPEGIRLSDAHPEFVEDCRDGIVLNRYGKPYTKNAVTNLDSSLNRLPKRMRKKQLEDITSGMLQSAVDDFRREKLSTSRIRSVIHSLSALYRWALKREKATHNPAESIDLPANDSKERERIAPPGEFAYLLDQLEPEDALPFALAAYGTARSQEIRALEWPEVDFEDDVLLLASDDEARKSEAARRIVPMVKSLRASLHAEWVRQGQPSAGRVCPPRRKDNESGMVSLNALQKRVAKAWKELELNPIGLQDSRHTAATWFDHAKISAKVASVFMGHRAPKRQPDAAPITLQRYTHVLPGELERARDQLDAFLAERAAEEEGTSFKLPVAA
jgi:integrase